MAPSGIARSFTGMSRLDSQNAALVSPLRCSMLCWISSRRRIPQKLGISPTALYGSIMWLSPMRFVARMERSDIRGGRSRISLRSIRATGTRSGRDARQAGKRHGELLLVVVLVDQLALEVVDVGLHVEVAVARHVEHDGFGLAFLLTAQRLVDRAAHRVRRLRRRHDAF